VHLGNRRQRWRIPQIAREKATAGGSCTVVSAPSNSSGMHFCFGANEAIPIARSGVYHCRAVLPVLQKLKRGHIARNDT
jgi:hypothetical protein